MTKQGLRPLKPEKIELGLAKHSQRARCRMGLKDGVIHMQQVETETSPEREIMTKADKDVVASCHQ